MARFKYFDLTLEHKGYDIEFTCEKSAWGQFSFTYVAKNPQVLISTGPFTYLLDALRDAIKTVDKYA